LFIAIGIVPWFEPAYIGSICNFQGSPVGIGQRIARTGAVMSCLQVVLCQGFDGYFIAQLAVDRNVERLPVISRFGKDALAIQVRSRKPVGRLFVAAGEGDAVGIGLTRLVKILNIIFL